MIVINILISISASILMLVGGTIPDPTSFTVGIILHIVSLFIELLSSTFPARYLYGIEQEDCTHINDHTYPWYVAKSYGLFGVYVLFTLITYFLLGINMNDITIINELSKIGIILIVSLGVISYWSMVFKPVCSVRSYNNDLIFYENDNIGHDSDRMLAFLFLLSFIFTNINFGIYYNDIILHHISITVSLILMLSSLIIKAIYVGQIRYYKEKWEFDSPESFWLGFLSFIGLSSFATFIYAVAGNVVNDKYPATYEMKVYFIIQGIFPLAIIGIIIILLLGMAGEKILKCCMDIPTEYQTARDAVEKSYQNSALVNGCLVNPENNLDENDLENNLDENIDNDFL